MDIASEVDGKKIVSSAPNVESLDSLESLQHVTQPSTSPFSMLPPDQSTAPPQSARSSQQSIDGYTNTPAATAPVIPHSNRGLSEFESANEETSGSISPIIVPEMLSLWTPPSKSACQQHRSSRLCLRPPSPVRRASCTESRKRLRHTQSIPKKLAISAIHSSHSRRFPKHYHFIRKRNRSLALQSSCSQNLRSPLQHRTTQSATGLLCRQTLRRLRLRHRCQRALRNNGPLQWRAVSNYQMV